LCLLHTTQKKKQVEKNTRGVPDVQQAGVFVLGAWLGLVDAPFAEETAAHSKGKTRRTLPPEFVMTLFLHRDKYNHDHFIQQNTL